MLVSRSVAKYYETLFSQFPMDHVFLLVPPTVLLFIEDTSNFQDFLIVLKLIYTPFKRVSKVTELDVGKSQNRCAYQTKYLLMIPNTYLIFHLGQI